MNEQDLHLAKAMVRMDLQESPKVPRKTVVSKVQEKLQNFRSVQFVNHAYKTHSAYLLKICWKIFFSELGQA